MTKSFFGTGALSIVNANVTTYFPVFGEMVPNATESNRSANIGVAGTFSSLSIRIESNSVTATSTLKLRKNSADGNMVISIGSGNTGFLRDVTNTDTVSAGDNINYQLVTGASGTSMFVGNINMIFEPTNTALVAQKLGYVDIPSLSLSNSTRYISLNDGVSTIVATESLTQTTFRVAGTLQYLDVRVSSNARNNTTTVTSRKNSADGNMSVSIESGITGEFEDTSNSDTISVNDVLNTKLSTGGGTQAIKFEYISTMFTSENLFNIFTTRAISGSAFGTGAETFVTLTGGVSAGAGTRNLTQVDIAGTLSKYEFIVGSNTLTSASTAKVKINGSNSSISISIGAGTTGSLTDLTNTETIASGDEVAPAIDVGTGGSFSYNGTNLVLEVEEVFQNYEGNINESTVNINQTLTRLHGALRLISEPSVTVDADSITRILDALRPISEPSVTVDADSITRILDVLRLISEPSITVGADVIQRLYNALRQPSDTTNINEELTRLLTSSRTINEPSISIVDNIVALYGVLRTISEPSVSTNDTVIRLITAIRALPESVTVNETIERLQQLHKAINEGAVNITDEIDTLKARIVSLIEQHIKYYYSLFTHKSSI